MVYYLILGAPNVSEGVNIFYPARTIEVRFPRAHAWGSVTPRSRLGLCLNLYTIKTLFYLVCF
jgi:hypothetical protein